MSSPAEPFSSGWIGPSRARLALTTLAACLLFSLTTAASGSGPMSLGNGLMYLRIHSLAESGDALADALAGTDPLVLDFRHANAGEKTAARLASALKARPAGVLLIALVSPDTPKPIASVLARMPAGALTLGIEGSAPSPSVIVHQSPKDDRAAYDALENGKSLDQLVTGKIDKERYDESTLSQDFANGYHDARPPAPVPPESESADKLTPADGDVPDTDAPARLTDRVLQRAIQLHRALLALRERQTA